MWETERATEQEQGPNYCWNNSMKTLSLIGQLHVYAIIIFLPLCIYNMHYWETSAALTSLQLLLYSGFIVHPCWNQATYNLSQMNFTLKGQTSTASSYLAIVIQLFFQIKCLQSLQRCDRARIQADECVHWVRTNKAKRPMAFHG